MPTPLPRPRDPDTLLSSGLEVIERAYTDYGRGRMLPLFSGGHDSYCAVYVASQSPYFDGRVYHINTGIGSCRTRAFVEQVCKEEGWKLVVLKNPRASYEDIVRHYGFPGPSIHPVCYRKLKGQCLRDLTRRTSRYSPRAHYFPISGVRRKESDRRLQTRAIRVGDAMRGDSTSDMHLIWVSPCYDWSTREQIDFMNAFALLRNPVKDSVLGMSGECFCGAFARPYELDMIREVCPDVAVEIDRLAAIAETASKPSN